MQATAIAKSVSQLNNELKNRERNAEKERLNGEIIGLKRHLTDLKDIREKKENALNKDFKEVPAGEAEFQEYHEKLKQRNLEYFMQKAEPEDESTLEGMDFMDLGSQGGYIVCGGVSGIKIFLMTSKGPLENAFLDRYKYVKGIKCIHDGMFMVWYGVNNDLVVL